MARDATTNLVIRDISSCSSHVKPLRTSDYYLKRVEGELRVPTSGTPASQLGMDGHVSGGAKGGSRTEKGSRANANLPKEKPKKRKQSKAKAAGKGNGNSTKRRSSRAQFIGILHRLVTKENGRIVEWTEGGRAILIKKPELFAEKLLFKYCGHKTFTSFERQMNFYRSDRCVFVLPIFNCFAPNFHLRILTPPPC